MLPHHVFGPCLKKKVRFQSSGAHNLFKLSGANQGVYKHSYLSVSRANVHAKRDETEEDAEQSWAFV